MRPGREARLHRKPGLSLTLGLAVVAAWTQPVGTAIDFSRTGIRAAIETGSPVFACYRYVDFSSSCTFSCETTHSTLVWRESEMALDFARKAQVRRLARTCIVSQQRFIADHAGPDHDLLHLQRCAVRRGSVRGSAHRGPDSHDGLLVLDPQTEGAVPVGRLRRGTGSRRQGEAVARGRQPARLQCWTISITPR